MGRSRFDFSGRREKEVAQLSSNTGLPGNYIHEILLILEMQNVNRLEITPNKKYLAAAGNPHIRLFDINSSSHQPVCKFSFLLPILLKDEYFI